MHVYHYHIKIPVLEKTTHLQLWADYLALHYEVASDTAICSAQPHSLEERNTNSESEKNTLSYVSVHVKAFGCKYLCMRLLCSCM